MLYALSIQSFVLIDRLNLEAADGFTALTGETGAGKSIILDAISLVLGGAPDRKMVRKGDDRATITAEFALPETHPAWEVLEKNGLAFNRDETLVLRRSVAVSGPSRAFVCEQPVAASVLCELGDYLVEIHGQHASSRLMRPSTHVGMLDAFAGNRRLTVACAKTWRAYQDARTNRQDLETRIDAIQDQKDWLVFAIEDLSKLCPLEGEVEKLSAQRSVLLQSERISESIDEAIGAVRAPALEAGLTTAAKAIDRVVQIRGLDALENDISGYANIASQALERALIELTEAYQSVEALARYTEYDANLLEQVETRLFALRAAARKYDCQAELLHLTLAKFQADLELCTADSDALEAARETERESEESWRNIAQELSERRTRAAEKFEQAIHRELEPLHLGRVQLRVAFEPLEPGESGLNGLERIQLEAETNPGAGFGPLKAIASGGELARFSLALKCVLSQSGESGTLIFDEVDHGVGGAVAAAIGDRLSLLGEDRQVFAITHSPQVASTASRQWQVLKENDGHDRVFSRVTQLDDGQRLEEIARMLSGSSITDEARAAASKLLEVA